MIEMIKLTKTKKSKSGFFENLEFIPVSHGPSQSGIIRQPEAFPEPMNGMFRPMMVMTTVMMMVVTSMMTPRMVTVSLTLSRSGLRSGTAGRTVIFTGSR